SPKRGIGAATIEKSRQFANLQDSSLFQAILDVEQTSIARKTANKLMKFHQMMTNLIKQQAYLDATEMVKQVLEVTDYQSAIQNEKTLESRSRLENIEEFLTVTQDFERTAEEDNKN